ncbi:MAG: hypothetical protein Q4Q23_03665 [Methanobacteriaceae archaeon]|nr:hypothetical protein [Methanobacteriaceae archaeon]
MNNNANNTVSVLFIQSNNIRGNILITGSKIINNTVINYLSKEQGNDYDGRGAILITNANVVINDTLFEKNNGLTGGAITLITGDLNITNSNFNDNIAYFGGAIANNGTLIVKDSNFNNNTALLNLTLFKNSGNGGAIGNNITTIIKNCNFTNNTAENNGGVISNIGNLTSNNNQYLNNNAITSGVIHINTTLQNIFVSLLNDTFKYNQAILSGVGYITSNNVTVINCKFIENSALNSTSVMYIDTKENNGKFIIKGSEFINNTVIKHLNITQTGYDCFGTILVNNSNLFVENTLFDTNNGVYGGAISLSEGNLTINNSTFNNNNAIYGGAIVNKNGTIIINNSMFYNNSANYIPSIINRTGRGGAIAILFGKCNITNTTFDHNTAYYAGAIVSRSDLNIKNSTFKNNHAKYNDTDSGNTGSSGAIANSGNFFLINSSFINNTAEINGGAITNEGTLLATNNEFINNTAEIQAGAIGNHGILNSTNNTYFNNNASYAGAINLNNTEQNMYTNFINDTFDSNHAIIYGSIFIREDDVTIINSTFKNNYAINDTSCVGIESNGLKGSITINGSNFTNNTVHTLYSPVYEKINESYVAGAISIKNNTVLINNCIFDSNNGSAGGALRVFLSNVTINNSQFNNNSAILGGAVANWDGVIILNNNSFTNNTAYNSKTVSIEVGHGGAINNNGFMKLDNNTFINNTASTKGGAVYLIGVLLDSSNNYFENNSAIYGSVTYVSSPREEGEVILTNITAVNNTAEIGTFYLIMNGIKITCINVTFDHNNAKNTSSGMYINSTLNKGTVSITQSTFTNNTANNNLDSAGVIQLNNIDLEINQTLFDSNKAIFGAAINVINGNLNINNSTFTNNNAITAGGAIANRNGTVNINNTIFTNNTAGLDGGAIAGNGTVNINQSTFINNTAGSEGGALHIVIFLNSTNNNFTNNKAPNGAVIFNNGITIFNNNIVNSNTVTNDYGFVIYNNKTMNITNNLFINNTNNTNLRDMLIDTNTTTIYVSNNTYINNWLNNTLPTQNYTINPGNTTITFKQEIILRSLYNNTIVNGTIEIFINEVSFGNYTILNGNTTTDIIIKSSDLQYGKNNITISYYNINSENREINYIEHISLFTITEEKYTTNTTINVNNITYPESNINIEGTVANLTNGTINIIVTNNNGAVIFNNNITITQDKNWKINISGLTIGNYNVTVSYTNTTGNYANFKNTTTFSVFANDVIINIISLVTVNTTNIIEINGTVLRINGTPVSGANVTILIDGEIVNNVITDMDGSYTLNYSFKSEGVYTIVSKLNSGIFTGVLNATTYIVVFKTNTNISINPINGNVTDIINITGILTDYYGNSINNASLVINIGGDLFNVTTNSTGGYRLEYVFDQAYNKTITVYYNGNETYLSSQNRTTVNITLLKSVITVANVTDKLLNTVIFNATITDENGNLLDGGNIVFKLNGVTIKDSNGNPIKIYVTNGTAYLEYYVGLQSGVYNLSASYSGNKQYGGSRSLNSTATFVKRDINIQVTINQSSIQSGNVIQLIATVEDLLNSSLNCTDYVVFKLNGVTIKDSNGNPIKVAVVNHTAILNYTISLGTSASEYNLTAVTSSNIYNRAENTTTFNITKMPVQINLNNITMVQHSNLTITGSITDLNNQTTVGTNKIAIKINGKTIAHEIVTNGIINVTIPSDITENYKVGTYNLTIVTGERKAYTQGVNSTVLTIKSEESKEKIIA